MRARRVRILAVMLGICLCCPAFAEAGETFKAGGTGAASELLRRLGESFAARSGLQVEVAPSLGSSGGINAVADSVLDIAVSGRALKEEERRKGISVVLAVRTPFVLATSHPSPNGLRAADVADAFTHASAAWSDGTPIRVILRPRSESDTALMGQLFPGLASALELARQRPDIPIAATDQDNADLAEQTAGSLVGSTYLQIKSEQRNLRLVTLDGIEPTFSSFERGVYRYAKVLYFVAREQPGAAAQRFIDFLRSSDGQRLLREAHTLSVRP